MQKISSTQSRSFFISMLLYCLLLFVLSRAAFFFWAEHINQVKGLGIAPDYLFSQLDSVWYLMIVKYGYSDRLHLEVFFPLLPLLVKGLVILTHSTIHIAGQIIVNCSFLGASCLFYYWLAKTCDIRTARIGVAFLSFTPYTIYFMAFYTESLFLVLSLGFWVAAKQQKWFLMGVCGMFLSACHPNGILIGFFALGFMVKDYRIYHTPIWRYWPIILIPYGLGGYMYYLHIHFGNAFDFVTAQHYWSRSLEWKIHGFGQQFATALKGQGYNVSIFMVGLLLSLYLWRRKYHLEALFIPLMTVMGPASGSFAALARYTATLFPFYFALALLTQQLRGSFAIIITLVLLVFELFAGTWLLTLWLAHSPIAY